LIPLPINFHLPIRHILCGTKLSIHHNISSARNIEETKSLENPQPLDILENSEPSDVLENPQPSDARENPQPGPSGMHLQSVHVLDDEHNEQSDNAKQSM
jgi:hypothetical protein